MLFCVMDNNAFVIHSYWTRFTRECPDYELFIEIEMHDVILWLVLTPHNNGGGVEVCTNATYLKAVVGGKQGHAPCKIVLLQQFHFIVSVKFRTGHKTDTKLR